MAKRKKGPKRKRVSCQLAPRKHAGQVTQPYAIMERLIATERDDLKGIKIVIAWRLGWRANADGLLRMGQMTKRGDLDRELGDCDLVMLLNKDAFPTLTDAHKERLIHHELTHAQIVVDDNGLPKRDDRKRLVCRIRRHDIEEFREIVQRYGWADDLSDLGQQGIADADRPLLKEAALDKAIEHGPKGGV